jgi:Uma2 family endonuclease
MQLVLNDVETQAPVILHPPPMTDEKFFDFCQLYPDFRIERTAEGEVIIMPPTAMETGFRNNELSRQLGNSGAALSPDASWVANSRLAALTREQMRRFTRISPDFVVELMSPSDRLNRLQKKMCEWIQGGVKLGWLIDPDKRVVYVYSPGQEPESIVQPDRLEGTGASPWIRAGTRIHLVRPITLSSRPLAALFAAKWPSHPIYDLLGYCAIAIVT